ncbi:MAG: hypothetical protein MUF63_01475 [Rhodobacteraceae bacterium]|nr:hypothetical protein [Paracoccaceae bacterium]
MTAVTGIAIGIATRRATASTTTDVDASDPFTFSQRPVVPSAALGPAHPPGRGHFLPDGKLKREDRHGQETLRLIRHIRRSRRKETLP